MVVMVVASFIMMLRLKASCTFPPEIINSKGKGSGIFTFEAELPIFADDPDEEETHVGAVS